MLGMVVVAIVAITWFQRSVSNPDTRRHMGALGGALDGFDAVLNPQAVKAKQEREEQSRMRAPIPSPGDLPRGIHVVMNDDGVPTKVIIDSSALHPERDVKPVEGS